MDTPFDLSPKKETKATDDVYKLQMKIIELENNYSDELSQLEIKLIE